MRELIYSLKLRIFHTNCNAKYFASQNGFSAEFYWRQHQMVNFSAIVFELNRAVIFSKLQTISR
jgi:hypothetical protein